MRYSRICLDGFLTAPPLKRPRYALAGPTGGLPAAHAFVLPCRKIVLSFDENRPHDIVLKKWIEDGEIASLARQYPSVEFVVRPRFGKPACFKAWYINGHARVRSLQRMQTALEIWKVAEDLLGQSGQKYKQLLGSSKAVLSQNSNPRGVWSPLHKSDNGMADPLPRVDGKW